MNRARRKRSGLVGL